MTPPLSEPLPPEPLAPRYSTQPFPAYRYVPRLNPHPCADPRGHSYQPPGVSHPRPPLLPPERWSECEAWRFGVDLFNHAYWWETHEIWEAIWQQSDKGGPQGRFLQGLIQVAAALLKRHVGEAEGTARLLERSRAHLDFVAPRVAAVYMGLALGAWREAVSRYFAPLAESTGTRSAPYPFIVLKGA